MANNALPPDLPAWQCQACGKRFSWREVADANPGLLDEPPSAPHIEYDDNGIPVLARKAAPRSTCPSCGQPAITQAPQTAPLPETSEAPEIDFDDNGIPVLRKRPRRP